MRTLYRLVELPCIEVSKAKVVLDVRIRPIQRRGLLQLFHRLCLLATAQHENAMQDFHHRIVRPICLPTQEPARDRIARSIRRVTPFLTREIHHCFQGPVVVRRCSQRVIDVSASRCCGLPPHEAFDLGCEMRAFNDLQLMLLSTVVKGPVSVSYLTALQWQGLRGGRDGKRK